MKNFWQDDTLQFTRLLAEIARIGLSDFQYEELCNEMDLETDDIDELLDRARNKFEHIKMSL